MARHKKLKNPSQEQAKPPLPEIELEVMKDFTQPRGGMGRTRPPILGMTVPELSSAQSRRPPILPNSEFSQGPLAQAGMPEEEEPQ